MMSYSQQPVLQTWLDETAKKRKKLTCWLVTLYISGCPRGVMFKAMDCRIVVSEFKPQSRYNVHFRADNPRKGMNLLILPAMG